MLKTNLVRNKIYRVVQHSEPDECFFRDFGVILIRRGKEDSTANKFELPSRFIAWIPSSIIRCELFDQRVLSTLIIVYGVHINSPNCELKWRDEYEWCGNYQNGVERAFIMVSGLETDDIDHLQSDINLFPGMRKRVHERSYSIMKQLELIEYQKKSVYCIDDIKQVDDTKLYRESWMSNNVSIMRRHEVIIVDNVSWTPIEVF